MHMYMYMYLTQLTLLYYNHIGRDLTLDCLRGGGGCSAPTGVNIQSELKGKTIEIPGPSQGGDQPWPRIAYKRPRDLYHLLGTGQIGPGLVYA